MGKKISEAGKLTEARGADVVPVAREGSNAASALTLEKIKAYATADVAQQITQLQTGVAGKADKTQVTQLSSKVSEVGDDESSSNLNIGDDDGNVIVKFEGGHIKTKNFDSSHEASSSKSGLMSKEDKAKLDAIPAGGGASSSGNIELAEDESSADLNIGDVNGNVLAQFGGGHIKTKNFDSRNGGAWYNNTAPLIINNRLPIGKNEVKVLLIGSSYGIDTISVVASIAGNLGVNVTTGDSYKSGGTIAQYLDDISNGGTNSYIKNFSNGTATSITQKTPLQCIQDESWDIIILQDSAANTLSEHTERYDDLDELVKYVRYNATNPNVVLALNCFWTYKNNIENQSKIFENNRIFMKQSGIDLLVPSGSAILKLRDTSVNDGNDIYRDNAHLNIGVGRFTAGLALFQALIAPIVGIGIDGCTLSGSWNQGAGSSYTYPTIEVGDSNRATCIQCAKSAVSDIFNQY